MHELPHTTTRSIGPARRSVPLYLAADVPLTASRTRGADVAIFSLGMLSILAILGALVVAFGG